MFTKSITIPNVHHFSFAPLSNNGLLFYDWLIKHYVLIQENEIAYKFKLSENLGSIFFYEGNCL